MTGYVYITCPYGTLPNYVKIGYTTESPGFNLQYEWKNAGVYRHNERLVAVYETEAYMSLYNSVMISFENANPLTAGCFGITPSEAVDFIDLIIDNLDVKAKKVKSLDFANLFGIYKDKRIHFFCTKEAPFAEPLLYTKVEAEPGGCNYALVDIMEMFQADCGINNFYFHGSKVDIIGGAFDHTLQMLCKLPGLKVNDKVETEEYIKACVDCGCYLNETAINKIYREKPDEFEHFRKFLICYIQDNKNINWQGTKDQLIKTLKENWK
jgi:hypothetical protein